MYVIQRNPNDPINERLSPWKGCLHLMDNGFWYATELAPPTKFDNMEYANQAAGLAIAQFPEDEIVITEYEEVFHKKTIETSNIVESATSTVGLDWGNNDIPF